MMPVVMPMPVVPTVRAMRISSAGSSPTITIRPRSARAMPIASAAVSNAVREGLPSTLARLPVIAAIIALIAKLAPIARPCAVAKNGTWLAVVTSAPSHTDWHAASRSGKVNSRNQPV